MKVNIGPYLSWWGPYQIADLLRHFGVNDDRRHRIGERLSKTWVNTVCEWIHSKRKRTIKIRIDAYDSWSADSTLALIAAPLLEQLKATNHGIPGRLYECDEFDREKTRFYKEVIGRDYMADAVTDPVQDEKDRLRCEEIWNEIQDEIIFALKELNNDDGETQFYSKDFGMNVGEGGVVAFRGEVDHEGLAAYHKRINNGLVLFGRYFRNLWD